MVTITVKHLTPRCLNNDDGNLIFKQILPHLKKMQPVEVSFEGVYSTTSSFINSAFIELLDHFCFNEIRSMLKITHSNAFINQMIKQRFNSAQQAKALN